MQRKARAVRNHACELINRSKLLGGNLMAAIVAAHHLYIVRLYRSEPDHGFQSTIEVREQCKFCPKAIARRKPTLADIRLTRHPQADTPTLELGGEGKQTKLAKSPQLSGYQG